MAVIVEKDHLGRPTYKSVTFPPTKEELALAAELDTLLHSKIPEIEAELVHAGLLSNEIPEAEASGKGGGIRLWYELGRRLQPIVENERLVKPAERRWLWAAIRMHATPRILRKDRGTSRLHLDYCYRIAKLPWKYIQRFQWDDWVYLMDSRSLRMDPRSDQWIQRRISKLGKLSRADLRRLVRNLNAKLKNKDTSVFSNEELFQKYDVALSDIISQSQTADSKPKGRGKK